MSLIQKLKARAANNNPVRVGIIGAGKFGSMYLSQAPRTVGIHLVDRKSTRLNSSHSQQSRMPSSA